MVILGTNGRIYFGHASASFPWIFTFEVTDKTYLGRVQRGHSMGQRRQPNRIITSPLLCDSSIQNTSKRNPGLSPDGEYILKHLPRTFPIIQNHSHNTQSRPACCLLLLKPHHTSSNYPTQASPIYAGEGN